jgi:hypothetical protein
MLKAGGTHTAKNGGTRREDIGIVTSLMSNYTARVDFVKEREEYKTNFSFYKPETLEILQKAGSQTWIKI